MKMSKSVFSMHLGVLAAGLLVAGAPAHAASVTYVLDQSNVLPDGVGYLQVQVADGSDGAIDFTVQVLNSLSDMAAGNFGIQAFAFNVIANGYADAGSISNLPDGWRAFDGKRMDGFGQFDVRLQGRGNARLETLTFSITGVDGDTPQDYTIYSTGSAAEGHQFFAAKVAGFASGDCGGDCQDSPQPAQFSLGLRGLAALLSGHDGWDDKDHQGHSWSWAWQHDWNGGWDHEWDDGWLKDCITSGYFGGSTEVPLPGTAWLFMTGVVGAIVRARRRLTR